MTGRELKRHNDLFFLCALIEYVARATKNRNRVIVNALGEERLTKIYKLADIYHSDNIARVADDLIKECNIENDYFDITDVKYAVPSYWDIAKVYKRLIISVSQDNPNKYIKTLITVYNSWIADKIDDYNSSFYYDSADCIYQSYLIGKPL